MPFSIYSVGAVKEYLKSQGCSMELFDLFRETAPTTFEELMVKAHYRESDFVTFMRFLAFVEQRGALKECARKNSLVTLNCVHRGCQDKYFKRNDLCLVECNQFWHDEVRNKALEGQNVNEGSHI